MVLFTLVPKEGAEETSTTQRDPVEKKGKEGMTDDAYEPKDDDLD